MDKELFDSAQDALAKSKELHPGKAKHEYLLTGLTICEKCGSPLVGTCMQGKYRYYHCRGTYPTNNRPKMCDAGYIKADWLEGVVWDKVKAILSKPEVLMTEIGKLVEAEQKDYYGGNLEKEIRDTKRKLTGYAGQERRLMNVLRLEVATPDIVLDELNQMKREKEADEKRLVELLQAKESMAKAEDMLEKVNKLCGRIINDLDNCTTEDKKDAYAFLDLKVKADNRRVLIKGYVNTNVTIEKSSADSYRRGLNVSVSGQLSGLLPFHAYVCRT